LSRWRWVGRATTRAACGPSRGASPNPNDRLEVRLAQLACAHRVGLADAQRLIATDWVAAYRRYVARRR
jgi:hypothetical protein